MTPKGKAKELFERVDDILIGNYFTTDQDVKKICLFCCDEIIDNYITSCETTMFYRQVKTEIEKL